MAEMGAAGEIEIDEQLLSELRNLAQGSSRASE